MRGKASATIPPIRSGDRLVDDDKEKANIFGRLLVETFSNPYDDSYANEFKQQVEEEVLTYSLHQDAYKLMDVVDESRHEVSMPKLALTLHLDQMASTTKCSSTCPRKAAVSSLS